MKKATTHHSRAKELTGYSFLVVFANDQTIDEKELQFLERLALEDREVDEEEKRVLRNIFARVDRENCDKVVWREITDFRKKYGI